MLDFVLARKNASLKVKITVKTLVSLAIIALAVGLPQLVHIFAGNAGGVKWLPMYLPVLLGGCLLGFKWGLGVGLASPLVSFILTSLGGSAMPALARLPFMMAELAVYAAVSGAFSKKIMQNGWWAFVAVAAAEVSGRAVFMLLVVIFQSLVPFTPAIIWSQIQTGFLALCLQAIIVPALVMVLRKLMLKNND